MAEEAERLSALLADLLALARADAGQRPAAAEVDVVAAPRPGSVMVRSICRAWPGVVLVLGSLMVAPRLVSDAGHPPGGGASATVDAGGTWLGHRSSHVRTRGGGAPTIWAFGTGLGHRSAAVDPVHRDVRESARSVAQGDRADRRAACGRWRCRGRTARRNRGT